MPFGAAEAPCSLFWGGLSSAQIVTLGIPQNLTPKLGGYHTGKGYSVRGAETKQGSPAERASANCLWGSVWASACELDWSWFLFTSSPKASFGALPTPSLCCCHCSFPQGVGRLRSGVVEKVFPILQWAAFQQVPLGQRLSDILGKGGVAAAPSLSLGSSPGALPRSALPPDLLSCALKSSFPLTGQLSAILLLATNSVY